MFNWLNVCYVTNYNFITKKSLKQTQQQNIHREIPCNWNVQNTTISLPFCYWVL